MRTPPRLGAWGRSGRFVGLVAGVDEQGVTLFDPGARRSTYAPRDQVQILPVGAVTVTLTADLPLPHGLGEDTLRRWLAALTDPHLREQAGAALVEASLDAGAALPTVRMEVTGAQTSAAVCLCGARTPAPAASQVTCAACGRQAASPPA